MADVVTQALGAWKAGDPAALERLISLVYEPLRALARARLAGERRGHTLQPTDLVHEAYLRLADHHRLSWRDSAHFYAIAAITMRRILVSHARRRGAAKRGGAVAISVDPAWAVTRGRDVDVLALDEALAALARLDERQCRIVELRAFGGLTIDETAAVLAVSPATVKNDWRMARAWLYNRLRGGDRPPAEDAHGT